MRSEKLNAIMWGACLVLVAALASSVLASSFCTCPLCRTAGTEQAREARTPAEQVRKVYIHSNSLLHHIQKRNRGKTIDQWTPGDKAMYTSRAQQVQELLV